MSTVTVNNHNERTSYRFGGIQGVSGASFSPPCPRQNPLHRLEQSTISGSLGNASSFPTNSKIKRGQCDYSTERRRREFEVLCGATSLPPSKAHKSTAPNGSDGEAGYDRRPTLPPSPIVWEEDHRVFVRGATDNDGKASKADAPPLLSPKENTPPPRPPEADVAPPPLPPKASASDTPPPLPPKASASDTPPPRPPKAGDTPPPLPPKASASDTPPPLPPKAGDTPPPRPPRTNFVSTLPTRPPKEEHFMNQPPLPPKDRSVSIPPPLLPKASGTSPSLPPRTNFVSTPPPRPHREEDFVAGTPPDTPSPSVGAFGSTNPGTYGKGSSSRPSPQLSPLVWEEDPKAIRKDDTPPDTSSPLSSIGLSFGITIPDIYGEGTSSSRSSLQPSPLVWEEDPKAIRQETDSRGKISDDKRNHPTLRKSDTPVTVQKKREPAVRFWSSKFVANSVVSVGTAGVVGALIGACIGLVLGPIGLGAGACIGAALLGIAVTCIAMWNRREHIRIAFSQGK